MIQEHTLWAGQVYVLDVFALRQKPEFVKIRLTFGKVKILTIFVRVTLRLKSPNRPKSIRFSSKSDQKRGDKSAQANLALRNKGGFLGRQMLLTPPLTLGLREVVNLITKRGG